VQCLHSSGEVFRIEEALDLRKQSGTFIGTCTECGCVPAHATSDYGAAHWNGVKDDLLHADLANVEVVEAGRSRMKFLTLTPAGAAIVTETDGAIAPSGSGGLEHEYWRATLRSGSC
jgi:hypothetical protein